MPEDKNPKVESQELSVEPPIKDLEQWLDHQADQLGTPTWWGELQAVLGITDLRRFAQKITGILPTYQRSGSGHLLTTVILHPQLLSV